MSTVVLSPIKKEPDPPAVGVYSNPAAAQEMMALQAAPARTSAFKQRADHASCDVTDRPHHWIEPDVIRRAAAGLRIRASDARRTHDYELVFVEMAPKRYTFGTGTPLNWLDLM